MEDRSSSGHVRQFTSTERQELINFVADRIFRRLLCKRSIIWVRWIGATFVTMLAAVRYGADIEEAIVRLLEGWPKVLHALGLA